MTKPALRKYFDSEIFLFNAIYELPMIFKKWKYEVAWLGLIRFWIILLLLCEPCNTDYMGSPTTNHIFMFFKTRLHSSLPAQSLPNIFRLSSKVSNLWKLIWFWNRGLIWQFNKIDLMPFLKNIWKNDKPECTTQIQTT